MGITMGGAAAVLCLLLVFFSGLAPIHGYGVGSRGGKDLRCRFLDKKIRKLEATKAAFLAQNAVSPSASSPTAPASPCVYHVTSYGADPSGQSDSTDAILKAISDAFQAPNGRYLMPGIPDLGGSQVHLEGGTYKISQPLRLPSSGGGNFMIHGGSLRASDDFPTDRHLIELWPSSSSKLKLDGEDSLSPQEESFSSSYEFITLKDLLLDSNFRGGGISVINSLRTTIDNCYIAHFTTDGILVQGGHETLIKNSFIGQHITSGGDAGEKKFSGVGITLAGNDNVVTDVVIFSAAVGIMVAGQANTLTGVHCYNKATGWGGTGIYVRLPGLSQTRILNCYLDYTGVVAEDPVQLVISGSFFLDDASVLLKSVKGVISGVTVVDNVFSGSDKGVDIVQLDQSKVPFSTVNQVVVDRNSARGMRVRSTVGKGWAQGNGTMMAVDFSDVLLFPDMIKHAQYTLLPDETSSSAFFGHAMRATSGNRVVVETDSAVPAKIYVWVDQNSAFSG
ncbi:polygalacturonase QRT3-like [Aristolochia californica]|uniref:polygalacturonase QRT3-like n=1 Tax=Aristolochia californica TaxID=171875 RepID=UPI0035E054F3